MFYDYQFRPCCFSLDDVTYVGFDKRSYMKINELVKWLPPGDSEMPRIQHILRMKEEELELEPEVENLPKELEDPYRRMFQLKPPSDEKHFVGNEYFLG
jgi:hypothetical protein